MKTTFRVSSIFLPFIFAAICLLATNAVAQVPRTISYQGVLTNGGVVANGQHLITVALYDSLAGGTMLYQESQEITVSDGIFNIEIGAQSPIPQTLAFDQPYFLGVSVDGNPEMAPRSALDAAPYALNANIAELAEGLTPDARGVVTSINELAGPLRITGDSITTVTENGNDIIIHARATPGAAYTAGQGISISNDTISATGGLPPAGTVLNSTLRWNGTAWTENPDMTSDANGNTHIDGSTTLGNGKGADSITMNPGSGAITVDGFGQGVVLSSANGVLSSGLADLSTDVTGVLPVIHGGTGLDNLPNGELLVGNGTNPVSSAQLAAGSGISIAQNAGNIVITNTGSVGWSLTGNSGTSAPANFLGTTDNQALVIKTNSTEAMRVTNAGYVGIGTTTPVHMLNVVDNTGQNDAEFENNNSSTSPNYQAALDINNRSASLAPTELCFCHYNTASVYPGYAVIDMVPNNLTSGSEAGSLVFGTRTNGPTNVTEKMRITNDGKVGIGTSTPSEELNVSNGNFLLSSTGTTADTLQLQGTSSGISSFAAGAQGATTINYTLPTSQPSANQVLAATAVTGAGPYAVTLGWSTPSGGGSAWDLTGNSGTTAGTNFIGTTDNTPMEILVRNSGPIANAIILNSNGSLQHDTAGNARGLYAVDWQMTRSLSTQVASGQYSTIGGGNQNTASGMESFMGGGLQNTASGSLSFVGGGQANTASGGNAIVVGGFGSVASNLASFIGMGSKDTVIGQYSDIVGGAQNVIDSDYGFIGSGFQNIADGTGATIPGGSWLKLGASSFGYNAGSFVSAPLVDLSSFTNISYFGNTDLWLGNNDNSARALRFYAPSTSTNYSSRVYSSFLAGSQSATINYSLPTSQPSANQVLSATAISGSGPYAVTLGWADASGSTNGVIYGPSSVQATLTPRTTPLYNIAYESSAANSNAAGATITSSAGSGGNYNATGLTVAATGTGSGNTIGISVSAGGSTGTVRAIDATGRINIDDPSSYDIAGTRFLWTGANGSNTNTFVGNTGNTTNTQDENTFVGYEAGNANTDGYYNTYIGAQSGQTADAISNTFVGHATGQADIDGIQNTFMGDMAGTANTHADGNTFIGQAAGVATTTGGGNTFIGAYGVGAANLTGANNTAVGVVAGRFLYSGSYNAYYGDAAGYSDSIGGWNTMVGTSAGYYHKSGNYNAFLGSSAGSNDTDGQYNTFVGATARPLSAHLSNASAIGYESAVGSSNSMILGSINGVNGASSDVMIGIGTTIPQQKFNVGNGNVLLSRTGSNAADTLQLQGTSTGISSFVAGSQSATINYTLPTSQPSANQVLSATAISGSGPYAVTLGWASSSGGSGWSLTGNSGTTAGTNFLGTTDDEPFEIHVYDGDGSNNGSKRVMRYEPNATSANIIGGYQGNTVSSGVVGATIAGGGANGTVNSIGGNYCTIGGGISNAMTGTYNTIAGGSHNAVTGTYGSVVGGSNNGAGGSYSTVCGGEGSSASGSYEFIGGGQAMSTSGNYCVVGGGQSNGVSGSATYSFIGAGQYNSTEGVATVVSGGVSNNGGGAYSAVGGGTENTTGGSYSVIPGGDSLEVGASSFGMNVPGASSLSGIINLSTFSNISYFGNMDLWLGNTDNSARALRFYSPGTSTTYSSRIYSSFVAGSQSATINYTLPLAPAGTTGNLLWTTSGTSSAMSWTGNLVWNDANSYLGINTTTPAHPVHSVNAASTDEIAALYGIATASTTNQAIGAWGRANNTSSGNTGTIGVLATGNGNTTAGQSNVALQLNDGEFAMGRTTESPSVGSDVEPATGGTAYSQQGPSGIVELTLGSSGNLQTSAPTAGVIQDLGSVTINNRYTEDGSVVLTNVVAMIDDGNQPNPQSAAWIVNADNTASGSFVIRVKMIPAQTSSSNYSSNDKVRVGYVIVNKSK